MSWDPIVFYNTVPGRFTGQGTIVSSLQWDNNAWNFESRLLRIEDVLLQSDGAVQIVSIADFVVTNSQLTIQMTDDSTRGPFTLPTAGWSEKSDTQGLWAASTGFVKNEVFREGGVVYAVAKSHISDLTFDPDATDGSGNALYAKIGYTQSHVVTITDDTIVFTGAKSNWFIRCTSPTGTTVNVTLDSLATMPIDAELIVVAGVPGMPVQIVPQDDSDGMVHVEKPEGYALISGGMNFPICIKKIAADTIQVWGGLLADDSSDAST